MELLIKKVYSTSAEQIDSAVKQNGRVRNLQLIILIIKIYINKIN